MAKKNGFYMAACLMIALALLVSLAPGGLVTAQDNGPAVMDEELSVRTVLGGLVTPIGVAFIDEDHMFVIEKDSGRVLHVADGAVAGTALDLAVNFASERGLLGITLDPDFDENGYVYLFWTCSAPVSAGSPYFPAEFECADEPMTGDDTDDVLAVPLLGNRVDRFVWDGSALTWDSNLVKLRAFQHDGAPYPSGQGDEEQPPRGNHNGGVIDFGKDGKLYIAFGDVGRRGAMQNLPFGPISYVDEDDDDDKDLVLPNAAESENLDLVEPLDETLSRGGSSRYSRNASLLTVPDDQFGGPYPDDAHYTGVIIRLNPDGSIPTDNPFYRVGAALGGEVGENIQMTFAYGIRNTFGMDIDPRTGYLWMQENGEDAYDELNLVRPGFNSGWIQLMGPASRVRDYKEIETTSLHFEDTPNLQQLRWGPENIADSRREALNRLFRLPGSHYRDPAFSWQYAIAPAAIGFLEGDALGDEYENSLFVGLSVPLPEGGPLLRFELSGSRTKVEAKDRIADNGDFNSLEESEEFLFGTGFGVVTDIETGPNGNLYIVSIDHGAVYEIFKGEDEPTPEPTATPEIVELFADLSGANEVPGPGDEDGTGESTVTLNTSTNEVCYTISVENITLPATAAHIHIGGPDEAGPPVVPLTPPDETGMSEGCEQNVDAALVQAIADDPGGYYVNVHNADFPGGAVRGQLSETGEPEPTPTETTTPTVEPTLTPTETPTIEPSATPTETETPEPTPTPVEFTAMLTGAAEVPGPGDEDGTGDSTVTVNLAAGEVCYTISVENITLPATAAHIHIGGPAEAGPPVVPLTPPDATGMSEGCVADADPAVLQAIVDDPAGYYVNVHNADYPGGAVRGQLSE